MRERITAALKEAVKAEDSTRIATLRLVLATLKDREAAGRDAEEAQPDADEALEIFTTMIKQRDESIRAHEESGQIDLAAREQAEIDVIREFMPRPMSSAEIQAAVSAAIAETEAASIKDLGRVIAMLKTRHPGRIDLGKVGAQVRAALV